MSCRKNLQRRDAWNGRAVTHGGLRQGFDIAMLHKLRTNIRLFHDGFLSSYEIENHFQQRCLIHVDGSRQAVPSDLRQRLDSAVFHELRTNVGFFHKTLSKCGEFFSSNHL
jgi:hypothetical protein